MSKAQKLITMYQPRGIPQWMWDMEDDLTRARRRILRRRRLLSIAFWLAAVGLAILSGLAIAQF